jgi:hypothetical protein
MDDELICTAEWMVVLPFTVKDGDSVTIKDKSGKVLAVVGVGVGVGVDMGSPEGDITVIGTVTPEGVSDVQTVCRGCWQFGNNCKRCKRCLPWQAVLLPDSRFKNLDEALAHAWHVQWDSPAPLPFGYAKTMVWDANNQEWRNG